jgi:general stress protein 26
MADTPKKDAEIEARFWKALRSDMTVMLGLGAEIEQRPMTAQVEGKEDHGPIWFFGSRRSDLVEHLGTGAKDAQFAFVSKGHDVWASVFGTLTLDMNRQKIDELWNSHVAAWYENGKDDPDVALLRFDPTTGKIWKDGSSLVAYALSLIGRDPKKDYKDNVAEVDLS